MATHTTLNSLFADIADEIRAKKGTSETIVADNFPTEIANLPSGGDPSEYFNTNPTAEEMTDITNWAEKNFVKKMPTLTVPNEITNIQYLCANMVKCPKVICGNQVTNIQYLYNASSATSIDITGLNVENVTRINSLFASCQKLKEMDLSSWDLEHITTSSANYLYVFNACHDIEKIKVPKTNVHSLRQWFSSCYSLKTLVITDTSVVYSYNQTFSSCYHMDGTVNAIYNPQGLKDGRIYVPDALVNDYKSASGWSNYADQILPLSQYVEE